MPRPFPGNNLPEKSTNQPAAFRLRPACRAGASGRRRMDIGLWTHSPSHAPHSALCQRTNETANAASLTTQNIYTRNVKYVNTSISLYLERRIPRVQTSRNHPSFPPAVSLIFSDFNRKPTRRRRWRRSRDILMDARVA